MSTPVLERHDPFASLRIANYRHLTGATFLITCALMIQRVALGYELYLLTRDPLSLGLLGLAEAVPFMGIALYGGHLADRRNKKHLMQMAGGIFMLGSALLLWASTDAAHALIGSRGLVFAIYTCVFIEGLARGFYHPASSSLRPFLVPRALYANAATWHSTAWQFGAIFGPAIGGFLYAGLDLSGTLAIVLVLLSANIILVGTVRPPAAAQQAESPLGLWQSLREGLVYVRRTRIIFYSISLDMLSVLFGGVVAILPIFAEDILRIGPEGLGLLRAAPAVGAAITMLICAWFPPTFHAWRNLLLSVLGFGLATLVFGLSENVWLSALALFATGVFDSVSVIIRGTILQVMTEDHMRGRVSAVNSVFISASNELGAFESGLAAKLLGTVPSVVFGAGATLAIAALVWRRSRGLFAVRL